MTDQNWMSADELRAVADYCESLQPLWEALTSGPRGGISVDIDSVELRVYDANGDELGYISWGDNGPAFYARTDDA